MNSFSQYALDIIFDASITSQPGVDESCVDLIPTIIFHISDEISRCVKSLRSIGSMQTLTVELQLTVNDRFENKLF